MTIETLTTFFGWMTAINLFFFLVSVVMSMALREYGTQMHARMFGIEKARIAEIWYIYLGAFKIAFIMLNLVPFLALWLAF